MIIKFDNTTQTLTHSDIENQCKNNSAEIIIDFQHINIESHSKTESFFNIKKLKIVNYNKKYKDHFIYISSLFGDIEEFSFMDSVFDDHILSFLTQKNQPRKITSIHLETISFSIQNTIETKSIDILGLTGFTIRDVKIDSADIIDYFSINLIQHLEKLAITYCIQNNFNYEKLLDIKFKNLLELDLSQNKVTDEILFDIINLEIFPKLKSLNLQETKITAEILPTLISNGSPIKLNRINLSSNEINRTSQKEFMFSETIEYFDCYLNFDADGYDNINYINSNIKFFNSRGTYSKHIIDVIRSSNSLEYLNLEASGLSNESLSNICNNLKNHKINFLDISWNEHLTDFMPLLKESSFSCKSLYMNDSYLGINFLTMFFSSQFFSTLESLEISGRRHIDDMMLSDWCFEKSPRKTQMKSLVLNNIPGNIIVDMFNRNEFNELAQLDLQYNQLYDADIIKIINSNQFEKITQLNLQGNKIGDYGLHALIEKIKSNKIVELDILNNNITTEGVISFLNMIEGSNIETIMLRGEYVDGTNEELRNLALKSKINIFI